MTQVIGAAEEGFLLHNRLTHSLKVAQVARRIAERLCDMQPDEAEKMGCDPDVVETAALAHDLGHPPFGHLAELALDDIAKKHFTTDGFEGNAQSFRIVTKLARRVPQKELPGLNLTRASLAAILKYPWKRGAGGKKEQKWGAFESEDGELKWARALFPAGDERKSAEAEIMDWADDIAYSVHDVEDFYRVGLIPLDRLAAPKEDPEAYAEVAEFLDGAFKRRRLDVKEDKYAGKEEVLRQAFHRIRESFFPRRPYRGLDADRGNIRVITGTLIDAFASAITLYVPTNAYESRVVIDEDHEAAVTILKELTWYYVINNPSLAAQQYGQKRVIQGLYEILEPEALRGRFEFFPNSFRETLQSVGTEREKRRAVIDLIAGMTERQALTTYHRLTGVNPGSALDRLYLA